MSGRGRFYIGVGGWTFEPWRGVFYPPGLTQARELEYASRQLTSIEINGTYYGSQKPESFRKWHDETPEGFVFSVKGPRFAVNRRVLAEAGESIDRFFGSGVAELGAKLGPCLWQFAPTKKFDADDVARFLDLLPQALNGRPVRHVIEARHDSFCTPDFIRLLRERGIAPVHAEHGTYPAIADVTTDFVYLRLQRGSDVIETAYAAPDLDAWADRLRQWSEGGQPGDAACIEADVVPPLQPRDVFAYVIHEGKVRAPAGAMALMRRVGAP